MLTLLDVLLSETPRSCCAGCASGKDPCSGHKTEHTFNFADTAEELEDQILPADVPLAKATCRSIDNPGLPRPPKPGCFYRIQPGDTLLTTAARAFSVPQGKERLALARTLNNHPFNRRFWGPGTKLFPEGLISFTPRFAADLDRQQRAPAKVPRGSGFAAIWIPEAGEPKPHNPRRCKVPGLDPGSKPHMSLSGFGFARVTLPSETRSWPLSATVSMIFLGLGKRLDRRVDVFVVGHASPSERRRASQRLGLRRASAIKRSLQRRLSRLFPGTGRLPNLRFIVHSCGHQNPVADDSAASLNRRVEIFLFVENHQCIFPREFPRCALQPNR